jgi:hypothetical protein
MVLRTCSNRVLVLQAVVPAVRRGSSHCDGLATFTILTIASGFADSQYVQDVQAVAVSSASNTWFVALPGLPFDSRTVVCNRTVVGGSVFAADMFAKSSTTQWLEEGQRAKAVCSFKPPFAYSTGKLASDQGTAVAVAVGAPGSAFMYAVCFFVLLPAPCALGGHRCPSVSLLPSLPLAVSPRNRRSCRRPTL